ncbi:hypothetical protein BEN48_02335 [Hymenobacter glacialis]|uniref:OmpA-like domain-containing protein n=2 Tax=Hymenobacter glacialis TaxID=1908236 RepID=A0A1G1T148_9BACT|nr:hypothetical protein BEN48_02335 [Hymenobacter glacialis]
MVDETELSVRRALNKSVPLTLKGLLNRVESRLSAEELFSLVHTADAAGVLKQLANPSASGLSAPGTTLLRDLLGSGYRVTVQEIAVEAGIQPTASAALLEVVATAVLGVLGRAAVENEFIPDEFANWLRAQREAIGPALLKAIMEPELSAPVGLPLRTEAARATTAAPALYAAAPWAKPAMEQALAATAPAWLRWQWGALLLLAVSLGFFFGRGHFAGPEGSSASIGPDGSLSALPVTGPVIEASVLPDGLSAEKPSGATTVPLRLSVPEILAERRRADTPPTPTPNAAYPGYYDAAKDHYIYDTGPKLQLTLADGSSQRVGTNSTERRLYSFLTLAEAVDSVNRTKGWINLDRVNFSLNRSTLTPESMEQLGNLASILNAYPRSVVKIGGYTDSTGDAELNYHLSEARARTTMLALARLGVSPSRLQSRGYGPRYFVLPNKTALGRAVNRRVSIRVVDK